MAEWISSKHKLCTVCNKSRYKVQFKDGGTICVHCIPKNIVTEKTCNTCGSTKSRDLFPTKGVICKSCKSKDARVRITKTIDKILDYLLEHPCVKCGYTNPIALDFHHRDPLSKEASICEMKSFSWDKVQTEIEKCDVLCANCHRIEHSSNWHITQRINERGGIKHG